jgi:acyl-CoA thioester hydrolase
LLFIITVSIDCYISESMFYFPVRVYYEDTDAGGVTYYANYLKFCERARTEWLRHLGFSQQALASESGIFFVVRRVETDYLQSARLDDELMVSVQVEKLGRVSIEFCQEITRGDTVLARCRTKVGCVSGEVFKPCALPETIAQAARRFMQAHDNPASGLK